MLNENDRNNLLKSQQAVCYLRRDLQELVSRKSEVMVSIGDPLSGLYNDKMSIFYPGKFLQ